MMKKNSYIPNAVLFMGGSLTFNLKSGENLRILGL